MRIPFLTKALPCFCLFILSSCACDTVHDYVFLGHIYQNNTSVDERVAALDLSQYQQVWLGGDVCAETTADKRTIQTLDTLFDLGSPTTHWVLGNHDVRNGNIDWITTATGRPTFYASHFNGLTLLVLNTTFSQDGTYDTTNVRSQFELIQQVCDTIRKSSHLIVLTHHVVWKNVDQITNTDDFANGDLSKLRFNFDPDLNYVDGVYPLLRQVAKRGVMVLHIAGDLGQKASTYQAITSDSIRFIGSGISADTKYHDQFPTAGKPDRFLVFHHNICRRTLSWTFEELRYPKTDDAMNHIKNAQGNETK